MFHGHVAILLTVCFSFRDEIGIDVSGNGKDCIRLEQDILMHLAGLGKLYVYNSTKWWSQIKTAG